MNFNCKTFCGALLLTFFFGIASAFGQIAGVYEMRLVNDGSPNLSFEMQCLAAPAACPTTSDAILDITFIIRWDNSYNVNLGTPVGDYGIIKSSVETVQGIYEFQIYQISVAPWFFPVNWTPNTWYTMATIPVSQTGTGTGTFEIAPTGFNPQGNPNFNVSGTDYLPAIVGAASNVPLPIELAAFSGKSIDCRSVQLTWRTQSEQDNAFFDLEHSYNIKDWVVLSQIQGQGNSTQPKDYSFSHRPEQAGLQYYRLRQVDYDGTDQYSPIISLNLNCTIYKFYPNPVIETVNIEGPLGETASFKVWDRTGALMLEGNLNEPSIFIGNLAAGIYFLELYVDGKTVREKIVKQ